MSVRPVYDPKTEGFVYHVEHDPQAHTESVSDIITETTESSTSGMTILSDDVPEYFIEHHGRPQPANENAVRWFPTDNRGRYILRHILAKHINGHNYLGPAREMLRSDPEGGKRRHVLEIGTREGTWVQEMATEFPDVQFLSLDIVPITAHEPRPNIVFEVYDVTEGLILEDNSQDMVFINVSIDLIRDYRALLREIYRVLRPGGLIHTREYALGIWDPRDDSRLARQNNPNGCRVFDAIREAISKFGVDPDTCTKIPRWLSPDSDLWKDSDQTRGFERIHTIVKTCPAYPHNNHPCSLKFQPHLVPLLAHHYVVSVRESLGLICDGGMDAEEARQLIEAAVGELKDPEKCVLVKMYTTYAIKRG